ncbi:hypothetical protein TorRG33x02_298530 [Trema orientale]|uniref:Uncharacterized protein n=1 Tax=Trema orientale TaxID=63057 RepID=A0A2P5C459_TREOI|nr:hypothetical protein TorRG33x02_298530 [Trema orientale]
MGRKGTSTVGKGNPPSAGAKPKVKGMVTDNHHAVCCTVTKLKLKNVSHDAFVIVYLDEDDGEMHHDVIIKAIEAKRKKAEEKVKREEEERLKREEEAEAEVGREFIAVRREYGGRGRRRSFFEELVNDLNGNVVDYKKKVVPRHNLIETQEEIAKRKEAKEKAKRKEEERLKREEEEWQREEELRWHPDEETERRNKVYLSRHRAMAIDLAAIERYHRGKHKTNNTIGSATAKTNTT